MNTRIHALPIALAAAVAAMWGAAAVAQQQIPEVNIQANRSVKVVGTTPSGGKIEQVTLTHRVSYADLDLASSAGAQELTKRIDAAATDGCKQLDTLYPLNPPAAGDDQKCIKAAVDSATVQANKAIAAAQQQKAIHTATAPTK
ncbi:MAG TPA: UrcA family protein [Steroidobacteraceae bacterium]|nr:UrcA family protein [Steroidobacteraceae bacterium]